MIPLRAFRSHPRFAPLFNHVAAVFWPILWWQLNRLLKWCQREGIPDVLYSVSGWGFITVRYAADKPGLFYQPPARTFRPLTDAGWESSVPATVCDLQDLAAWLARILSCKAGDVSLNAPEGAFTPPPNTS
ncbi:hypothetical protein [Hyphomonas sp.]|uniref:hypothetical protein n=1 Tax=Hyphomonas sp. TaxID=87 RepID=UPI00391AA420